jgi:hypothetical protein
VYHAASRTRHDKVTMTPPASGAAPAAAVVPFWERLPRFFLFPFALDKLAFLLLLSVGSLVAFVLPLPGPLAFVVVEGFIWLTAFRHAFRTMDLMAHGYIDAEAQSNVIRDDPARKNLPWKMAGLLLLWSAITGFVTAVSGFLGFFATLFVSAAIPAMTMQLCASNDFSESMSPARWWHYMRKIGPPYLALFVFLFLLMNGAPQALTRFIPLLGGPLTVPIVNFVLLYFNLIMFALMGYVMYQYHAALGLEVDVEPAAAEEKPPVNPEAGHDARVGALLAAGQSAEAVQFAEGLVRNFPEHWPAYERLHKLLAYLGLHDKLRPHQKRSFTLAMKLGRHANALALYRDLAAAGDPVTLLAPQVLPLAKAAERAHDITLALELVRGFRERFPGHPDIPGVQFFTARIASERLKNDAFAKDLLKELIEAYPKHELAAEAKRTIDVIDRLAGAARPKAGG